MDDDDPEIVISDLSCMVEVDDYRLDVSIHRLEHDSRWSLEVINENGTSIVWEDPFDTDEAAFAAFEQVIEEEGLEAFLDEDDGGFQTLH